jgi:hypothetical protein
MKKRTKIGLAILVIFLGSLAFGISEMVKNPDKYQTEPDVDKTFMNFITEKYGAECKFNMGDHQVDFNEGRQEYIGIGSFEKKGMKYAYNYRGFIQDNTVEFVKISIFDENGEKFAETYDGDKETEHLDSLKE